MEEQKIEEVVETKEVEEGSEESLKSDGLKFIGIVFAIAFIFIILLPFISRLF